MPARTVLDKEKEILSYAARKEVLLSREAVSLLAEAEGWQNTLEGLAQQKIFYVTKEEIERQPPLEKERKGAAMQITEETAFESPKLGAGKISYRVLEEYDITGKSYSEGKVQDFLQLFQNRFSALKAILERRGGFNPKPLSRIRQIPEGGEVDLIGMVAEKWETKSHNLALQVEDQEGRCLVVVSQKSEELREERKRLMLDDVVGIRGKKLDRDMILAEGILWPDLPQRSARFLDKEICIAHISDIHVGSRLFLEKEFRKFLGWLKGGEGEAGKVRYLMVSGDNVDGIGVYPQQYNELTIKDIREQYRELEKLLLEIPEHIQVFMIPGQHDAVRWADPQPAVPGKLLPLASEKENIHLLGSPSWVEIEGFLCVLYHGASVHEFIANISGLSYSRPSSAVVELLKRRTLAGPYGIKQPFVPEKKDYLSLPLPPDFIFLGDLHRSDYANYRGTTILNGSCWQGQTAYQKKLGHQPTPCQAAVVNLKTRKIRQYSFMAGEEEEAT